MTARLPIALALLALAAAPAAAGEPTAFACNFVDGTSYSYEQGRYVPEKAAPLSFGIEAIDEKAQTADLRTERGTGQLRIVQAVNAMHFLEVVTEGFLNVTTVYDKDPAKDLYPAVHSRHIGLFGQPIVSQYHGFCSAKD
jgi:hypothetical protein